MRDLDALLHSLVNIDRNSLIAILTSEVEAVRRLANSARQAHRVAARQATRGGSACRPDRSDFVVLPAWRRGARDVRARRHALQIS